MNKDKKGAPRGALNSTHTSWDVDLTEVVLWRAKHNQTDFNPKL